MCNWKRFLVSVLGVLVIGVIGIPRVFTVSAVEAEVSVSAASCIVMEAVTGEILYEKEAYTQRPMASTTKIMTTLLCLESGDLDTEFVVDAQAIQVEGSSMGLVVGDTVTKRTLCYGMLLPSGNDAAGAVAVRLAGSYAAFAEQMNAKAAELGMTQTHFVTPSGLHDDAHYSTAYDMAILTAAALQNEDFREICGQSEAQVSFGNPPYARWLENSNKLLTMDDRVIGVKTGFTDEAGRCLVSAEVRDGVTLICVTLDDSDDWNDHLALYDACFAKLQTTTTSAQQWEVPVVGSTTEQVTVGMETGLTYGTVDGIEPAFTYAIETAPFLYAPVTTGVCVGTWTTQLNGRTVASGPLYTMEEASYETQDEPEEAQLSWLQRLWKKGKEIFGR